jgi:hypothetical protein
LVDLFIELIFRKVGKQISPDTNLPIPSANNHQIFTKSTINTKAKGSSIQKSTIGGPLLSVKKKTCHTDFSKKKYEKLKRGHLKKGLSKTLFLGSFERLIPPKCPRLLEFNKS